MVVRTSGYRFVTLKEHNPPSSAFSLLALCTVMLERTMKKSYACVFLTYLYSRNSKLESYLKFFLDLFFIVSRINLEFIKRRKAFTYKLQVTILS